MEKARTSALFRGMLVGVIILKHMGDMFCCMKSYLDDLQTSIDFSRLSPVELYYIVHLFQIALQKCEMGLYNLRYHVVSHIRTTSISLSFSSSGQGLGRYVLMYLYVLHCFVLSFSVFEWILDSFMHYPINKYCLE